MDEGTKLFLKFRDILHGNYDGLYFSSEIDVSKVFPKSAPIHSRISSLKKYLEKVKELVKSNKADEDGMYLLMDAGLSNLMVESVAVFGEVSHYDGATPILDELLDTVNMLADLGSKVEADIVSSICGPYLLLLVEDSCSLLHKTEICRSLNILLENCPFTTKESLLNQQDFIETLKELFQLVIRVGDYEFQIGILECLFRLMPRKVRAQYASKFIQRESLDKFLNIRDVNFETDCRVFLNELNRTVGKKSRVYSIPCEKAIFGKKELKKPCDDNYEEFWVDFNYGTRRITLFCEQDMMEVNSQDSQELELWETVSVSVDDVKAYSFSEESGMTVASILLKKDISVLYPNMLQYSGRDFDLSVRTKYDMKKALMTVFGSEKCKTRKVSSVITPVQLNIEKECHHQTATPQSRDLKEKMLKTTLPYSSQRGNTELTPVRIKMSVPCIPMSALARVMTSPVSDSNPVLPTTSHKSIQHVRQQQMTGSDKTENECLQQSGLSNTGLKDKFIAPKTPTIKLGRPKVKTPVVVVKEHPKKVRAEKKIKQTNNICVKKNDSLEQTEGGIKEDEVIPDSFPETQDRKTKYQKLPAFSDSGIDVTESFCDEDKSLINRNKMKLHRKDCFEFEDECETDFKEGEKQSNQGKKMCRKGIKQSLSKGVNKDQNKKSSKNNINVESTTNSGKKETKERTTERSSSHSRLENIGQNTSAQRSSDLQSSFEVDVIQESQDVVSMKPTIQQVLNDKDMNKEREMKSNLAVPEVSIVSEIKNKNITKQNKKLLRDKGRLDQKTEKPNYDTTSEDVQAVNTHPLDSSCETEATRNDNSVMGVKTKTKENVATKPNVSEMDFGKKHRRCDVSSDNVCVNQVIGSVDKQTKISHSNGKSVQSRKEHERSRNCSTIVKAETCGSTFIPDVCKDSDTLRKDVSPSECHTGFKILSRDLSFRNDSERCADTESQDLVILSDSLKHDMKTSNKARRHVIQNKTANLKAKPKEDKKPKQVESEKKNDKRVLPSRKAKENKVYDDELDISENCGYLFNSPEHVVNEQRISSYFPTDIHRHNENSTIAKMMKPKNSRRLLSQSDVYVPEHSNASVDSDPYDFDADSEKQSEFQMQVNVSKPVAIAQQKSKKESGTTTSKFFKHRSETRTQNKSAESIATSYMRSWQQELNKKKGKTHILSQSVVSWKSLDAQTGDSRKDSPVLDSNQKKGKRSKRTQQQYLKETSLYSNTCVSSVSASIVENSKVEESFVVASKNRRKSSKFKLFNPDLSMLLSGEQKSSEMMTINEDCPLDNQFDESEKVTEYANQLDDRDVKIQDNTNLGGQHKTVKDVEKPKKQQRRKLKAENKIKEKKKLENHAESPGISTSESGILANFSAICKTLIEQSSIREEMSENDNMREMVQSQKTIQQVTEYSDPEDSQTLANDLKSELSWIAKKSATKKKYQKTYRRQRGWKRKEDEDSDNESDVETMRFRDNDNDLIMSSQEWEAPTKFSMKEAITPNILIDTPKLPSSKKRYSPLDVKFLSTPKTPKTPGSYHFSDEEDELYVEEAEPLMNIVPVVKKLEICKELVVPLKDKHMTTLTDSAHIQSGPSSTIRPSRSSLKRKYSHLSIQDDELSDFESSQEKEEDESDDDNVDENRFCPRKLFRMDDEAVEEQENSSKEEEDITSVTFPLLKVKASKKTHQKPVLSRSLSDQHTTTEEDLCTQSGGLDLALNLSGDIGLESGISTVVQAFGIDIQKQLQAKYQQLKEVTRGALKNTQRHINQVWTEEYSSRGRAMEHFKDKMLEELLILEVDVTALKNAEDKSLMFCQQQINSMETNRVSQETRLRNLKLLYSSLQCNLQEAEDEAVQKQQNLKHVMKKDLATLQKKLLSESNQHHMSNVKRFLKSMLF